MTIFEVKPQPERPKRSNLGSVSCASGERPASDLEKLEELKNKMFAVLNSIYDGQGTDSTTNTHIPKVGDLVKIIELQRKLSSDSKAEEKFWEMIEEYRQKELGHA